jgi:hypothetical protein
MDLVRAFELKSVHRTFLFERFYNWTIFALQHLVAHSILKVNCQPKMEIHIHLDRLGQILTLLLEPTN